MTKKLPKDPTLDEVREFLAPLLPAEAAFDGWTEKAVTATAESANIDADMAVLAFSNTDSHGLPMAMISAWLGHIDSVMEKALPAEKLTKMKIRDRITKQVEARLEVAAPHREALRRALSVMAKPQNLKASAKLSWHAADLMWRNAGDTATDYNHYTKRTILSGVYSSTLMVFIDDKSDDYNDTREFLARRIENVMQFEKAKAKWTSKSENGFSMSRFIGRLRYPAA